MGVAQALNGAFLTVKRTLWNSSDAAPQPPFSVRPRRAHHSPLLGRLQIPIAATDALLRGLVQHFPSTEFTLNLVERAQHRFILLLNRPGLFRDLIASML
jgi:hypothetical protein